MTLFHFEAFAPSGQTIEGVVEADSLPNALSLLRQRGINPYRAEPTSSSLQQAFTIKGSMFPGLGLEWRARTTRQIATLLAAGITLDRALKILGSQAKQSREKRFIESVLDKVSSGQAFSTAIMNISSQFKIDEIGLIRAGEQSGSLVTVLEELATLLERRLQLRGKLASALIYPAFLLALAPISLIIIATILVPNIAPLFDNSEATMPFALRAMIWTSEEFQNHGVVWVLGFLGLLSASYFALRQPTFRGKLQSLFKRLPMIGVVKKRSDASRICRTLGSLLRSGSPLQTALSTVTDVTADSITQNMLRAAKDAVSSGEKLATALRMVPALDATALQMIAIGEETNKLDTMLLFVADTEEKALANYIDRLMTLLTPILTVAMGLFVGGIVMSIMRAILSVNELAVR